MTFSNRHKLFWLVCGCCLVLLSCRPTNQESGPAVEESGWHLKSETVRGPFSFRVLVDKEEIDISDTFTVILEAETDEGYNCEFPKFGTGLEQFAIVDYHTETPRLTGKQKMLYRRSYLLEPMLAENYQIPSQMMIFREQGGGEARIQELESEPFDLEVRQKTPEFWQALDIDDATAMEPQQRLGPENRRWLMISGAAAGLLLLLAGLLGYWHRRRGRRKIEEVIPPHLKALQALQALIEAELVQKRQLQLFYVRISAILRTYIEERFSLRAPEQTTEEFLASLPNTKALTREQKNYCKIS